MERLSRNKHLSTMKYIINKLVMGCMLASIVLLTACEEEPTAQERKKALLLSATWGDPIVTVDGVDQTSLYQNLEIQFTEHGYTSSGGEPLWRSSGTWSFSGGSAIYIGLDGVLAELTEISGSSLVITRINPNTTFEPGRIRSIKGKNVFNLKKQ
jgi:hypothetical protein